jgi:hypothetical protein
MRGERGQIMPAASFWSGRWKAIFFSLRAGRQMLHYTIWTEDFLN